MDLFHELFMTLFIAEHWKLIIHFINDLLPSLLEISGLSEISLSRPSCRPRNRSHGSGMLAAPSPSCAVMVRQLRLTQNRGKAIETPKHSLLGKNCNSAKLRKIRKISKFRDPAKFRKIHKNQCIPQIFANSTRCRKIYKMLEIPHNFAKFRKFRRILQIS